MVFTNDQIVDKINNGCQRAKSLHISKCITSLGVKPVDIQVDLVMVYGSHTVSYFTITSWCLRLKQGRVSLVDDLHSGCPLSAGTEDEFIAMENLIDEGIH